MRRAPAVTRPRAGGGPLWRAAALAGTILSVACASSSEPAPEPAAPGTLDDARIESAAATYRGFTKINAAHRQMRTSSRDLRWISGTSAPGAG